MSFEEACEILTDEEADAIGYMVASENLEKCMIAAAKAKLEREAK